MRRLPNPQIQARLSEESLGIQFACDQNPDFGVPFLVAPGVWWVRLPVASKLQAVNVYLLEDSQGLALVDAGVRSAECREALQAALCHPDLESYRLSRVIVTHFHPDHMGLAGELARDGVELWTSRNTWLNCHLLSQNKQLLPLPSEVAFMQRAGLTGIELEAFRRRAGNRYGTLVAPAPDHFVPLVEGQTLTIGQRAWRVATSYGHAAEHITLWSSDCVISGDQILPSIASNLTVPYTEGDVDLVGEWLRSCRRLKERANDELLCLPGHQRPFYGVHARLLQIEQNIEKTLERLLSIVSQPAAALDCAEQVYGRTLASDERRVLLPEVVGMLNHLYFHGQLERTLDSEGVYRYAAISSKASKRDERKNSQLRLTGADALNAPNANCQIAPQDHAIHYASTGNSETDSLLDAAACCSDNSIASRISKLVVVSVLCLSGGGIYLNWNTIRENAAPWLEVTTRYFSQSERLTSEEQAVATIPVETIEAIEQAQAEVPRQFTGIVKPRRASQIGFNRIGVIDEILVERGDQVAADAVLARLNTSLLQANLKAVQAQYRAAEARLAELVAGPRSQTIESARAQVAAAKAEVDLARTSLQRSQRLIDSGAVSKQDLDNARTNVAAKDEALRVLQNGLDELLEGTRSEQVLAQRAQLTELEAAQEQLQVQMQESVLRTPFAATVSERYFDLGAIAGPGIAAFRLIDMESPEVWIGVPPEFISTLRDKHAVQLTIGDKNFPATVKAVLPELDEVTRTNTVIFEVARAQVDENLFGQVARIVLSRKLKQSGFWVPLAALSQGDQGLWALLALEPTADGERFVLRRREVEIVQVDSDRVFVRGTIESGTQLVANGVRRLTPGQHVKLSGNSLSSANDLGNRSVVAETMFNTGLMQ